MTRTDQARPTRRTLLAIGALWFASCNGSTKAAAPTTEPPITLPRTTSASTVPTTSAVVSTTSAPNGSPATSTSTTAQPTTTAAPTPEQAVRTAWRGWIEAVEACHVDPTGCDRDRIRSLMAGDTLTKTIESIDALVSKGWRTRLGPGGVDERYHVKHVAVTGTTAQVDFCQFDEAVIYVPAPSSGGPETLVNDDVGSRLSSAGFTLTDGRWQMTQAISEQLELGRKLWDSCVAG